MIRLALDYRHRLQRLPLSRAPETHLWPAVSAFSLYHVGETATPFLKSWPWVLPVALYVQKLQNRDVLEGIGARRTLDRM